MKKIILLLFLILLILIGGGVWLWRYLELKIEPETEKEILSQSVIEATTTVNIDESLNWKVYQNEKIRLEFLYPEMLPFKYESVFIPSGEGKEVLTLLWGEAPFRLWMVTNGWNAAPKTEEIDDKILEKEKITVGGVEVEKKVFQDDNQKTFATITFVNKEIVYAIWVEIQGEAKDKLRIFDQILSTVHFLE